MNKKTIRLIASCFVVVALLLISCNQTEPEEEKAVAPPEEEEESAPQLEWVSQFGPDSLDLTYEISNDPTAVYVAGQTGGALPGQTSTGSHDASVGKYDTDGNEVWTHQFGTGSDDSALGISVDSTGMYVAGYTHGALPGQTRIGAIDAFVAKLE